MNFEEGGKKCSTTFFSLYTNFFLAHEWMEIFLLATLQNLYFARDDSFV